MRSKRNTNPLHLLFPTLAAVFSLVFPPVGFAETENSVELLYKAADTGDLATVERLIGEGVDVNAKSSDGSYALNAAAVSNYHDLVRVLLADEADPNLQNAQGDTPLICTTKYGGGDETTVELLVEAGTDLKLADKKGNTALDYAVEKHQTAAMALLQVPE